MECNLFGEKFSLAPWAYISNFQEKLVTCQMAPCKAPSRFFLGWHKDVFALPSFWMGEQLHPCFPSFAALACLFVGQK